MLYALDLSEITMYKIIALLFAFVFASTSYSQTVASKLDNVYLIPYASSGNQIELDVVNTGKSPVETVQVLVSHKPNWLNFNEEDLTLSDLDVNDVKLVTFTFMADREAPIHEKGELKFEIFSDGLLIGTKVMHLQMEAPTKALLLQNYPNPFNPETTISFDLPTKSQVDLRIYDLLGREVALLAKEDRNPGHHRLTWDASQFASGTYFYVLKTKGGEGENVLLTEKMIFLK